MIKKLFIATAAVGLVINLTTDLLIYNQQKVSQETGDWLRHSYSVGRAIENAEKAVHDNQVHAKTNVETKNSFYELHSILRDPSQRQLATRLLELSDESVSDVNNNEALKILGELESNQARLLPLKLDADLEAGKKTFQNTLLANIVDVFLICLFISLFFIYKRQTSKTHAMLTRSLLKVEETNLILMNSIAEKDQRLKAVVHDLKNPLGSIKGLAEILRTSRDDIDSPQKLCMLIENACGNSLELVSNLLTNEDLNLQKTAVNLESVIGDVCQMMIPLAAEKGQVITADLATHLPPIWASVSSAQDILLNIVSNSIKFSPPNTKILNSCHQKDSFTEIRVKDEGPGFKPEDFERMFTYGGKLSARPTSGETSNGIGLYSVHKLVLQLGGSISAINNPEGGATIILQLPIFPNMQAVADLKK